MGRVSIFISFAICMSSFWQMCDASCYGPVPCTDNSPCRDDQACLPSRDGTQTICRLCYCNDKGQCRTDPISRNVTCDCGNSGFDGPFCTCESPSSSCPPGFTRFRGTFSCYAGFVDKGNWSTAKGRCHGMGASLVKITSDAENTFVRDLMASLVANTFPRFWMGGSNINPQDDWCWDIDSTRILPVYSHWETAPQVGVGRCSEMFVFESVSEYHGMWMDVDCSDSLNYICECYP